MPWTSLATWPVRITNRIWMPAAVPRACMVLVMPALIACCSTGTDAMTRFGSEENTSAWAMPNSAKLIRTPAWVEWAKARPRPPMTERTAPTTSGVRGPMRRMIGAEAEAEEHGEHAGRDGEADELLGGQAEAVVAAEAVRRLGHHREQGGRAGQGSAGEHAGDHDRGDGPRAEQAQVHQAARGRGSEQQRTRRAARCRRSGRRGCGCRPSARWSPC